MSAETVTMSPTHRLAAYRPSSTAGSGYWMTMRDAAISGVRAPVLCLTSVAVEDLGESPARDRLPALPIAMNLERSSGVLLHLTSLPGGRLGREAYRFVDWLAAAGPSWWQVLPLVPPDRYHSPYKSRSAFAAWPGFLASPRAPVSRSEIDDYRERNSYWIEDWARAAGGGAIADQVRFEGEWGALRAYAAERGVKILGDIAIYVAP